MTRAPSFAGVLLAAGESSRMGRDKAFFHGLQQLVAEAPSSETFLSASIRSLLKATDFVIVVVGNNEAVLAPIIYARGASLVVNPEAARGQFSSLQVGLQEVLNQGRDAAVVTLVDRPPVSDRTVHALREAFKEAGQEHLGSGSRVQWQTRASLCRRAGDDGELFCAFHRPPARARSNMPTKNTSCMLR